MDLIEYYKFTYISLLYYDGVYGESGAKHLRTEAKQRGICFAVSERLSQYDDEETFNEIYRKIIKNNNARVIIIFAPSKTAEKVFHVFEKNNIYDYFIWILSDASAGNDYGKVANGYFYITYGMGDIYEKFAEHYKYLTPLNSSDNPWFLPLWEMYYDCKWKDSSCDPFTNKTNPSVPVNKWVNRYYDGAYVYALALNKMINETCPDAFIDKSKLISCVKGDKLLYYMKNVSFTGLSGDIQFNKDGDRLSEYTLHQYLYQNGANVHNTIGTWRKANDKLELNPNMVVWTTFIKDLDVEEGVIAVPDSVCSTSCERREFAIKQEVHCCWVCRKCRDNEVIVNSSSCSECPSTFWPDNENATTCVSINPTYMHSSDIIASSLMALSGVLLITTIIIISILYHNRERKLVKASIRNHFRANHLQKIFFLCHILPA